jgi:hypothetical protein
MGYGLHTESYQINGKVSFMLSSGLWHCVGICYIGTIFQGKIMPPNSLKPTATSSSEMMVTIYMASNSRISKSFS